MKSAYESSRLAMLIVSSSPHARTTCWSVSKLGVTAPRSQRLT
jgi:hypothetical protein